MSIEEQSNKLRKAIELVEEVKKQYPESSQVNAELDHIVNVLTDVADNIENN